MKLLKVIDQNDYDKTLPEHERFCVRGIVEKEGRIATQKGKRGDYKILGGGIEPGENHAIALAREIREEAGLIMIQDSIREAGEIEELHKDLYGEENIYHCHTYFYYVEIEDWTVEPQLTESEIAKGYELAWATPEEIICANTPFLKKEPWIYRDTEFVRIYQQSRIRN